MTDLSPLFWDEKTKFLVYIETKHAVTVLKNHINAKTYVLLENA